MFRKLFRAPTPAESAARTITDWAIKVIEKQPFPGYHYTEDLIYHTDKGTLGLTAWNGYYSNSIIRFKLGGEYIDVPSEYRREIAEALHTAYRAKCDKEQAEYQERQQRKLEDIVRRKFS